MGKEENTTIDNKTIEALEKQNKNLKIGVSVVAVAIALGAATTMGFILGKKGRESNSNSNNQPASITTPTQLGENLSETITIDEEPSYIDEEAQEPIIKTVRNFNRAWFNVASWNASTFYPLENDFEYWMNTVESFDTGLGDSTLTINDIPAEYQRCIAIAALKALNEFENKAKEGYDANSILTDSKTKEAFEEMSARIKLMLGDKTEVSKEEAKAVEAVGVLYNEALEIENSQKTSVAKSHIWRWVQYVNKYFDGGDVDIRDFSDEWKNLVVWAAMKGYEPAKAIVAEYGFTLTVGVYNPEEEDHTADFYGACKLIDKYNFNKEASLALTRR